jgi:hypothetical protein
MWKKYVNNKNLFERWWSECRPAKWLPGYQNRNRFGWDGPRKRYPLQYGKKLAKFEDMQYAFNKSGVKYAIPKWGG